MNVGMRMRDMTSSTMLTGFFKRPTSSVMTLFFNGSAAYYPFRWLRTGMDGARLPHYVRQDA